MGHKALLDDMTDNAESIFETKFKAAMKYKYLQVFLSDKMI